MNTATVIFARDDLSIPGAAHEAAPVFDRTSPPREHFFTLVDRARPDVIVLDFSSSPADGIETLLAIRQRTEAPILVVCNPEPPLADDYRAAGAAACIAAPVDIIVLHHTIQKIMRARGRAGAIVGRASRNFAFAGMIYDPERNLLTAGNGIGIELTNTEGRLLMHFLSKPRRLCTRGEIAEVIYGPQPGVGERAVDVLVNRLRKKLKSAGGGEAGRLITTEFRRGYELFADVVSLPPEIPAPPEVR